MIRRWSSTRLFLRSLLAAGSINERTMIGSGFAWALLPPPRARRGETEGREATELVPGPAEPFNSHPYLTPLALGATARTLADGTPPGELRRFLSALRSPLGSLGDRLIWGAWRPLCLLGAVLAFVLGTPPGVVVIGLLLVYNGLHLFLRAWGLRVGLACGIEVAPALGAARLPARSERLASLGVLILGVLAGLGMAGALRGETLGPLWAAGGGLLFLAGLTRWEGVRPWAPFLVFGLLLLGLLLP